MEKLNQLFNSQEKKILFQAIEDRNYAKLDLLIGKDQEKAKLIFSLIQNLAQTKELENKVLSLTETTSASLKKKENFNKIQEKIILHIGEFIDLILGESHLKKIPAGWHKGHTPRSSTIIFKEFTISKSDQVIVFHREQWFKSLTIKSIDQKKSPEVTANQQKKFFIHLVTPGRYQITLNQKKYELEIKK